MKQIYLIFLLSLALSPVHLFAKAQQRIVTMNLHCFEDHWEFRLQNILDYIISVDADVISFQEVCTEPETQIIQIAFIYDYLRTHNYPVQSIAEQYTHPAWNRYDEYLLMVSKHPSQAIDKGFLPKSLMQRGYIALLIEGSWYINLHLEYLQENASMRRTQIEYVQNRFEQAPQIIMGDFNSSPESFEQHLLWERKYTPVFPGDTFIGHDNNGQNKIDGFWVSTQYMSQVSHHSGKVILNQKVKDQYLSDHFGVMLNLFFH